MSARWLIWVVLTGLIVTGLACSTRPAGKDTSSEEKTTTANKPPAGPPLFEDVTAASGVIFSYDNGESAANHLAILESLGGGVGLLDFDGDGLLDLFCVGGGTYTGPDSKTIIGRPCKLFRNKGNLKFEDVTATVGLTTLANGQPWFYSHAVAVTDYDRDGYSDLLVTGWAQVALFRNMPDGKGGRRFEEVTARAGLDRGFQWATSAGFGDLDGDGYPDLYVCQYVDWSWKKHPACTYDGKTPDVCPPRNFAGLQHRLFHNNGKGGFTDVTHSAGLRPGGETASKGLGVLLVDLNADGKPEIYVCNDTVDKFLYVNQSKPGQLLFSEQGLMSGAARDNSGSPNGSMGVDAGDPLRDGKPALWVTNYENELHALYRNECRNNLMVFNYHTQAAGIAALGQVYVGWGTAFVDTDLDGWEDIFVTNGHAIRYPFGRGVYRKQSPVLLMNNKGRFSLATDRLGDYGTRRHLGRGAAFGDLDNDGRIDIVLCPMNEPVTILRGIGGKEHHWLGVQLLGKDHADYVGARVVLETKDGTQTRFAKGGGSYASANDRRLVFGLGTLDRVESLTVYWPDGTQQTISAPAVDRYHKIQASGTASVRR